MLMTVPHADPLNEPELLTLSAQAIARLETELGQHAPYLARAVAAWVRTLAQSPDHPEYYFNRPLGFPTTLLPWWLEKTFHPTPERTFQAEVLYSTINGYYFIRLIDNVMDGQAAGDRALLPALGFFHAKFQAVYHHHFAPEHPLWQVFNRYWFGSADMAAHDAEATDITLEHFQRISGLKVCAGKIPLAAVCYRYDKPELIEPWARFFDRYGQWHQMWNDLFDWSKDLRFETRTYFLAEAARRKQPAESVAQWVICEGFEWGATLLATWLTDLRALAVPLNSPDIDQYLTVREALLQQDLATLSADLRQLEKLARVWKSA